MGFDFTRPLRVLARAALDHKKATGVALALAVLAAPWAYHNGARVFSPVQERESDQISREMLERETVLYNQARQRAAADQAAEVAMAQEFSKASRQSSGAGTGGGTCFGAQMAGQPDLANIKNSTVMISIGTNIDAEHYIEHASGTGFIVADSSMGSAANRIVTAAHLVTNTDNKLRDGQQAPDTALGADQIIMVYGSDGRILGHAGVAAIGRTRLGMTEEVTTRNPGTLPPDLAVLHMDTFNTRYDAERKYRSIRGLDLAATPGNGWSLGQAGHSTPGVNLGASGAPIIDMASGQVRGVVTSAYLLATPSRQYNVMNLSQMIDNADDNGDEWAVYSDTILVTHNRFVANTLPDSILGVLGHTGHRVLEARAQGALPNPDGWDAIIPGMPLGTCVIAKATVGPVLAWGSDVVLGGSAESEPETNVSQPTAAIAR